MMALGVAMAATAQTQDVVYLNNGGIVKGSILEKTPSGTLKVQTNDGSVFVFNEQDIQSVTKENITNINGRKVLDISKHTFGLRVGALFTQSYALTNWMASGDDKNYFQIGGHVGGVYELSLNKTNRWSLHTGFDIQLMRGKYVSNSQMDMNITSGSSDDKNEIDKSTALYVDIPLMISCKFNFGKNVLFYPSVGASYGIGITGKYTHTEIDERAKEKIETGNPFDYDYNSNQYNNPDLSRHCFNLRGSLNFVISKHYYVGCGIIYGGLCGDHWSLNASIGYNF